MYLEILDSACGTVKDGDDLFAKYLNTMQNNGEKPSVYLQRLQVILNTTLRRGGVTARQFVRGCWDNTLIAELQLEQKKQNPPTFAELLPLLRTAQDKCSSKASRMKQHLNASKPRVSSHNQGIYVRREEGCSSSQPALDHRSEIQDLKKQIVDLQSQLTQKDSRKTKPSSRPVTPQTTSTHSPATTPTSQRLQSRSRDVNNNTSNRPRPWYCFRCGEDGHIKPQCESEPNPSLVDEKRKRLKENQLAWDIENGASKPRPLS